ncbi:putative cytoplasmic dynein 2 heavy chain 1 [Sesbania bispinosa]|nr:putative cytoplasmic dynein 2 heavy chain 1 [Sesbania bispinosa]
MRAVDGKRMREVDGRLKGKENVRSSKWEVTNARLTLSHDTASVPVLEDAVAPHLIVHPQLPYVILSVFPLPSSPLTISSHGDLRDLHSVSLFLIPSLSFSPHRLLSSTIPQSLIFLVSLINS